MHLKTSKTSTILTSQQNRLNTKITIWEFQSGPSSSYRSIIVDHGGIFVIEHCALANLFFEWLNNVFPGRPELSLSESVFSGACSSNSWSTIHSRARQTDLSMSQQLLFGSSENQYRFSQNRPRQYLQCFFFLFLFFFKSIFLMMMS